MARSLPRWGYHQLDLRIARRVVADAALPRRALVLDIGAGTGAITGPLVDAGHRVVAIELHAGRARQLEERFGRTVTVMRADAADLRLPRRPFHVVANPPYGILTALLRRLLHPHSRLQTAHLVVPDWTVQRWTTDRAPGATRSGRDFVVRSGPLVPRERFRPAPARHSRVMIIERR